MKKTKRREQIEEKLDRTQVYELGDALTQLQGVPSAKFDETVEVALRLGVDPRKQDQKIRGMCSLPHGLGRDVRVLVFAKGEKVIEAREAGADYVGDDDLVKKIKEGWFEFDRVIATPDMMAIVGRIGRILGPRGLMPNPKVGTVTFDLAPTIKDLKAGQIELKVDKYGNIHAPVGKLSFPVEKLKANVKMVVDTVVRLKPAAARGIYIKNCAVTSTMGPGLKVEL